MKLRHNHAPRTEQEALSLRDKVIKRLGEFAVGFTYKGRHAMQEHHVPTDRHARSAVTAETLRGAEWLARAAVAEQQPAPATTSHERAYTIGTPEWRERTQQRTAADQLKQDSQHPALRAGTIGTPEWWVHIEQPSQPDIFAQSIPAAEGERSDMMVQPEFIPPTAPPAVIGAAYLRN